MNGAVPPVRPAEHAQHETRSVEPQILVYLGLLLVAIFVGFLWKRVLVTIPAGHHGVMFYRLSTGTVTDKLWGEGLYIIAPWNYLTAYETRLQARTILLKVPSEEGLEMGVSLSLRYRPYVESLGYLHQDIGPDYFERLILPEVHGHLRKVLGKRKAQDIYTGAREIMEEIAHVPVLGRLRRELVAGDRSSDGLDGPPAAKPYVLLEELRVLEIVRPTIVADAVNEKQRQEQLSLEYRHRLQREEQEAERKRIEAAGIRDYNRIVGAIHPDVLRWRHIESTHDLASSNNAKVVVLDSSRAGLPVLLNLGDGTPAGGSAPAARTEAAPPRATAGKVKSEQPPNLP